MASTINGVRKGLAALLALALAAALLITGFATSANAATTGVSVSLDVNGKSVHNGNAVFNEGDTATFVIQYDKTVTPGSSVTFEVPAQFELGELPSTNTAVTSISREGNVVTLTFADPWPSSVDQGILSLTSKIVAVEQSSVETVTWKVDDVDQSVTIVIVDQGDTPTNVTDRLDKSVSSPGWGSFFELKDGTVTAKEPQGAFSYALTVNSATAREGFVITDTIDDALQFSQDSFELVVTTWDDEGLNKETTTTKIEASDPRLVFDGQKFTFTGDFPANSQAQLKYKATIKDPVAIATELQELHDGANEGQSVSLSFGNSALLGESAIQKSVTVGVQKASTPGIDHGKLIQKSADWSQKFVEFDRDEDGTISLAEPIDVTWTVDLDLTQFDGSNPKKTLTNNIVLGDAIPAGLEWTVDTAQSLPVTVTAGDGSTSTVDFGYVDFDGTAADFAADEYVGKWSIKDGTLFINYGKDTEKKYSVDLSSRIIDANALANGYTDYVDGTAKSATNRANFYWKTEAWDEQGWGREATVTIIDRGGDEGWNNSKVFGKSAATDDVTLQPGESTTIRYDLVLHANHGLDVSKTSFVDYIDHNVFDVSAANIETIRENTTVTYDWSQVLTSDQYTIELDSSNNVVVSLTEAGLEKIGATKDGQGRLHVALNLPTKPVVGKQTLEIENRAAILGENQETIYWNDTDVEVSSYGDEAEVRKSVRDTENGAWTQNLRAEVTEDGELVEDHYVYRVEFIPHGQFGQVGSITIAPVVDNLPTGVEFVGFVSEENVDDQQNVNTTGQQDIGGNLEAVYSADDNSVTIQNQDGKYLKPGDDLSAYILVKITDFEIDTPIMNVIGGNQATITPSDGYPLSVQKLDSEDQTKVIDDPNARFEVRDEDGNVLYDDVFIENGSLRVLDDEGNVKNIVVPEADAKYTVTEVVAPAGYEKTDEVLTITVSPEGSSNTGVIYNVPKDEPDPVKTYAIGDKTWIDSLPNGVQDPGEDVLPFVTVNLLQDGEVIKTTSTNAEGLYLFDELPAGDYQVQFVLTEDQAALYEFTSVTSGEASVDSDAGAEGKSGVITLGDDNAALTKDYADQEFAATEGIDPTWDAGVVLKTKNYAIGDKTWIDSLPNGVQDAGEEVLPGVTVNLLQDGEVIKTTSTNAQGLYLFDELPAGDYQVQFVLTEEQAALYEFTSVTSGEASVDSDAGAEGKSGVITLGDDNAALTKDYADQEFAATEGIDPTWDAGVVLKTYAVGDYTWIDSNRNGIQDAGEEVLPGVTVNLLDENGDTLDTTTTDENGLYVFDELPGGKYQLQFILTEEQAKVYNFTDPNQGTDSTVNSDANTETGITVHFNLDGSNNHLKTDYENASGTVIKATKGIDPTWDAGVVEKTYAVGDYTWIDSDRDGVQDDGEPVLPGVTVTIADTEGNAVKDINGDEVGSTVTDAEGLYLFDNLPAGDYVITFTLTPEQAEAYRFTTQNTGNEGSTDDSDANPTTGITTTISLNSENEHLKTDYAGVQATEGIDPTWDAGVIGKTYAVGDYTWIDTNRDGVQDDDEPVLPGVKVELLDAEGTVLDETVTDENGLYVFDERAAGEYQLRFTLTEEQAATYKFTTQNTGDAESTNDSDADAATGTTVKFTLNDENTQLTTSYENASATVVTATEGIDPTWDAGVVIKTYALGDYTWIDSDRDGVQDEGEPVLPGVTVNLLDENGEKLDSTTTDENGFYVFDELPGGKYQLEFVLTEEQAVKYIFTNPNQGENAATDSDANTSTGQTIQITLDDSNTSITTEYENVSGTVVKASEGIDPTWDAGVIERSYAIGDYTWIDEDRDGIQDEGEPVLPGVTVEITDAEGNPVKDVYGNTVEPTTTDENGIYVFDNLPAGDYEITFTLPEEIADEYVFTPQNQGDEIAADSDADKAAKTTTITLGDTNESLTTDYEGIEASEGIDPTWDAGVVKKSYAVGDYTWIDENRDGVQNDDEPVLPGVIVTITDAAGEPVVDVFGNTVEPTTTDENGLYVFDNLPKGDYVITFELPEEYAATHVFTAKGSGTADDSDADRVTGQTITISLNDANEYLTLEYSNTSEVVIAATQGIDPTWDAGIVTKSYAIGDFTWIDSDKDGVQDEGEPVLPGVKVELLDADGEVIAETVTDENGYYLFDELAAGEYQIRFTLTDEQAKVYSFTSQNTGDRGNDSDADSAGLTVKIVLDDSNTSLTHEYTIADVLATQGIDPTWDAGVIVKPGEPVPTTPGKTDGPTKTDGPSSTGGTDDDDLASTGAQDFLLVAIAAAVLALAGLGTILAARRRNQQV